MYKFVYICTCIYTSRPNARKQRLWETVRVPPMITLPAHVVAMASKSLSMWRMIGRSWACMSKMPFNLAAGSATARQAFQLCVFTYMYLFIHTCRYTHDMRSTYVLYIYT